MSAGLVCPVAVPNRTNEALREQLNYHEPFGPTKFQQHTSNADQKATILVRRPFKYLKHQGPRPVGGPPASTLRLYADSGPAKVRALSIRRASIGASHQRSPTLKGPKIGERFQTATQHPTYCDQKNENSYGPPASRLLSSRKLNLSALDISACQKRKEPQVEVDGDELTISLAKTPVTARLSDLFTQSRTSTFSDWSNSAPTSSRRSLTACETPTQVYLPKSSRDIVHKKRISSDPRIPMSLAREAQNSFQNTRSRSDFGLTQYN
ncbi:hypothetical protein MJO28_005648 [Puccinia striiformis f. sp. tritici]|uniref:Uncharacterized protein n=3 Tax=Puccinia striiformis TaxID=27350 RepID=A0A0L0V4L5_9BASI|nr:hypothetical protein Pst134EA_009774 [Puccinia striiformis f. sp. tritici]KAI9612077.1 hypothetical protein H4Q26_008168 [Puccinia striiformis f. sp. tritici PST-130]KNE94245.1 hypothetical protein PSTG_12377 [Puccinia striiformis f. sp. tritici PST-78]POW06295.1 hypothetical protein PSTT_09153 [Puccinia striiformis]KAH9458592.1 hypothetical protein Pst134EB_010890 [Puccinia striiformis f. sp. tritici]KAH9469253.1 hypothetical protein Pst134EA_009774 [Puccinia striiformis f. sp. tritici]